MSHGHDVDRLADAQAGHPVIQDETCPDCGHAWRVKITRHATEVASPDGMGLRSDSTPTVRCLDGTRECGCRRARRLEDELSRVRREYSNLVTRPAEWQEATRGNETVLYNTVILPEYPADGDIHWVKARPMGVPEEAPAAKMVAALHGAAAQLGPPAHYRVVRQQDGQPLLLRYSAAHVEAEPGALAAGQPCD